MSSSKHEPYIIDLDFIQDELRKQDEKKRKAEEARLAALAPKITDADVNQAQQQGHQQGLREGHENGKKEASDIYEAHIASINTKLDDMLSIKETYKAMTLSYTLNLLQKMLPGIVGEELEKNLSPLIMHHVQKLQSAITEDTRLILRINAASRDVLEKMITEKQVQLHKDLHIETNNQLADGDITLHWGNQGVEALVQHSLHHAEEILAGAEATHVPETDKMETLEPATQDAPSADIAPEAQEAAPESSPLPKDYFEVQTEPSNEAVSEEKSEINTPESEAPKPTEN
ncbi:MAG: hypothetical protein VX730_04305 [Pseudomonadota bacterium]|nr:hypothetical protein [Pseudomonadota bacterium]